MALQSSFFNLLEQCFDLANPHQHYNVYIIMCAHSNNQIMLTNILIIIIDRAHPISLAIAIAYCITFSRADSAIDGDVRVVSIRRACRTCPTCRIE